MKKYYILALVFILLMSCSKGLTIDDAENIALEQAKTEGYDEAYILDIYQSYAVLPDEHILCWKVSLTTNNSLNPIVIYYIDVKSGEIILSFNDKDK